MKIVAITQARYGSSRLPGKVLLNVGTDTLLDIHLKRLKHSKLIEQIVVATTMEDKAELILDIVKRQQCSYYQGSMTDVLDRYYQAAIMYEADWVVRVTSDCPLIDADLIDKVVKATTGGKFDYGTNTFESAFPDGQDVEVFNFKSLKKAWQEAKLESEREHVTPYIRNNSTFYKKDKFNSLNYKNDQAFSEIRMTVDEAVDFKLIQKVINDLGQNCTWRQYAEYISINGLDKINSDIIRNEGYQKSLKNDKK